MTRCSYDGIFYRVFCVTLLLIAFTFTVILTNVFIDIDGLLADKEKEKPADPITIPTPIPYQEIENKDLFYQSKDKEIKAITEDVYIANKADPNQSIDVFFDDNKDFRGSNEFFEPYLYENQNSDLAPERNDDYRTKRSIDTPNNKFHLANPKMKEILNNRLSTLLEELDAEESQTAVKVEKENKEELVKPVDTTEPPDTTVRSDSEEKDKNVKEENNVLHKAMHNILLQGIIGHMDLNEVYNKVHNLVQSYDQENDETQNRESVHFNSEVKGTTNLHIHSYPEVGKPRKGGSPELSDADVLDPKNLVSVESKFFDEMVKCEELQKQINGAPHNAAVRSDVKKVDIKAPSVIIKTIIDIKTVNKNDKQNDSISRINTNNIKGLIKLIYNGKAIKFSRLEDDENENKQNSGNIELKQNKPETKTVDIIKHNGNVVDDFLDHALAQYLKKYPKLESKFKAQRPKRSVKINKHGSIKNKTNQKDKQDEEELYVEIETHFDSKGINGEKKKKLIKNIITRIQKALRMKDTSQTNGKTKKDSVFQIKKRLQNPLKIKEEAKLSDKIIIPVEGILLRQIDPISKTLKVDEPSLRIYDKSGQEWKKKYAGSGFLSNAKSINSGEMSQVDLDYNQVAKENGVPQRLQQPLNSDNLGQTYNGEYYNIGDLKFYVKEIDGTGFSIGFNQYVGDAPDPDSIKVFTGLQQLINVYNQNNDTKTYDYNNISPDGEHEISKRDVSTFNGFGSIFKQAGDSHSDEYKLTFDKHYLPYDSYSEIFEDGHKKVSLSIEKEKKIKQHKKNSLENTEIQEIRLHTGSMPFLIDEDLFKKQLKPSEIFGLADLLNRKKRSPIVKIKKYSNMKTRAQSHINRYLNINRKAKRVLKNNNKRNKRQIDKIRIIATDGIPHLSRHSDENFFVVSDENMFADRAVVRDMDAPEQEPSENDDHNDFVHHMTNQLSPYSIFKTRHNSLMSKYPHLFLEEITQSREEQDNPSFYSKLMDSYTNFQKNIEPTPLPYSVVTPHDDNRLESRYASNYYDNSDTRPNYKLTVKIIPKNQTDTPTGFKSIHTSINKTINRNGLRYLSQMNVSELSKIENIPNEIHEDNNGQRQNSGRITKPENIKNNNTEQMSNRNPSDLTRTSDQATQRTQINMDTGTFPLVKRIKEQQEKMKMLLKEHKQRIDEQLDNLKQEKQNLDSMIVRSNIGETANTTAIPEVKRQDTIDVLLPLNPPQMLHLNRIEAGQLISNALMKLHDAPNLNDIDRNQNNRQVTSTTPSTTTQATTTKQTTTTTQSTPTATNPTRKIDPERLKLLRTIQRNENLTNVILYKIDRNTNLLQHFLQKLTDRLEPVTKHPEILIPDRIKVPVPPKELRGVPEAFFTQALPNMEVNKNASHISIPFVYAYQQPYPLPAANNPVASVVYQGHIHTNAYNSAFNKNREKTKLPDKREANNTKFFLDDLEPGFKVVPVPLRKEPYDMLRIKNNITRYRN